MKQDSSVSIVIPNWNGAALLSQYLPRVLAVAHQSEVIVVDDASTDDSVQLVQQKFPQVRLITKTKHEGFASTVNLGVARARGEIVVLLNSDVAPEPGFLPPLLSHFRDPKVFAVGCLEKSYEGRKVVLRGRGQAKWERGFLIHWRGEINRRDTAWVSGGSGAYRRRLWETLEGLDTLYNPFYWEDIDLSYRALKAGYRVIFEPKSVIHHFHEQGKIKREFTPLQIKTIAYRNQFIFIWKNLSDPVQIFQHAFWTPIRLWQALASGDLAMWRGYVGALVLLPKIMVSRLKSARLWRRSDRQAFFS